MYRHQSYTPSDKILAKYARLLVQFGLQNRNGTKLKKGSVVQFTVPEVAKPLYFHLQREILKAGHHPLGVFVPNDDETYNFKKDFFDTATPAQTIFFASDYYKGLTEQVDGTIFIMADTHPHALADVPAKKVMQKAAAMKPYKDMRFKKIDAGKLNWTLALYGTDAAAAEANMSTKAFWQQIIKACYLDDADPVKTWRGINQTVQKTAKKLTDLHIESLHVTGPDMDITLGIGADRAWRAGGGNNIPSYEVFTSPNYRQTNGWARFSEPHYVHGKSIEGVELWFKDGKVIRSKATKNHDLLQSMLKQPGGNQLGEFSLTDARLSRITKFMADTLYDENVGGKYGNTHMAIGSSFHDCYNGDGSKFTDKQWDKLGFNDSVVHSDIVSTTDRTVTATLQDGSKKVIYRKGQFTI